MVGLALVLPVNLTLAALGAFAARAVPDGAVLVTLSGDLAGVMLLGWAYLRLQKPLDEGVRWGAWGALMCDWIAVGWAFTWRVLATVLAVSLPNLAAGASAGFASALGGPAPAGVAGWLVQTQAVLAALAVSGWTVVYLWTFPLAAVRRDQAWRSNHDEGRRLTRRYWFWGVLWVSQALVWALLGPHSPADEAWYRFGAAVVATVFQVGQVFWLLNRPGPTGPGETAIR